MCSPVGHTLAALAVGVSAHRQKLSWPFIMFCLFSGNVADFDLFIGWGFGEINRYHHLGSHSIFAAVVYGILVYIIVGALQASNIIRMRWAITGALMYLSHNLLDLVSRDESLPIGLQLFWPFSDEFYATPFFIFRKFLHDTVGGDMVGMVIDLFGWHNLYTVIQEMLVLLPVLLICGWFRFIQNKKI